MFPKFRGLTLIPSRSASDELIELRLTLEHALDILNEGYDCFRSKRKKNIVEKCVDRKRKTIKAVAAKAYDSSLDEEVWVLTHVGKHSIKKR